MTILENILICFAAGAAIALLIRKKRASILEKRLIELAQTSESLSNAIEKNIEAINEAGSLLTNVDNKLEAEDLPENRSEIATIRAPLFLDTKKITAKAYIVNHQTDHISRLVELLLTTYKDTSNYSYVVRSHGELTVKVARHHKGRVVIYPTKPQRNVAKTVRSYFKPPQTRTEGSESKDLGYGNKTALPLMLANCS